MAAAGDLIAQCGLPRSEARALLAHLLGCSRESLIARPEQRINEPTRQAFAAFAARRRAGEPLAYLLGRQEFYGRPFTVSPAVLVPRPETELAIDTALTALTGIRHPRILDLGTGSGCIAITLALERPDAEVTGIDLSDAALAVARDNGCRLSALVRWLQGDWLAPVAGERFDLIVANPPYVREGDPHLEALQHEPELALTAGIDGLDALRRIAAAAAQHLQTEGVLLLEHGAEQGATVRALLAAHGWQATTLRDGEGRERLAQASLRAPVLVRRGPEPGETAADLGSDAEAIKRPGQPTRSGEIDIAGGA